MLMLQQQIDVFLTSLKNAKTQQTYKNGTDNFMFFLRERTPSPTLADVGTNTLREFDGWLASRNVSPSSRDTYIAGVYSFLQNMKLHGNLKFDLETAKLLRKQGRERGGEYLPNMDEIDRAPELIRMYEETEIPAIEEGVAKSRARRLAALRDKAFVEFVYVTGCRRSEARTLKRSQIAPVIAGRTKEIKIVGKGNKPRYLILDNPKAVRALVEYLDERDDISEYVFVSHDRNSGQAISESTAYNAVAGKAKTIGLNLSPHDLRRNFATHHIRHETPIEVVQTMLGHANIQTTLKYAKVNTERVKKWVSENPMPV